MKPIEIAFTIPNQSLFIGFGLLVFAITLFLAISNHREKFKRFANPLQLLADNYLWIVLPLGTLAIGFAVYEWIWQILPKVGQIITKLKPADETPENIRNLAYAIGALLAAVALSATIPFQLIKVWVNERLAKTTEQGHMTDRITKAVEQLGAEKTIWMDGQQKTVPNLEVRLGAIYALERIAQDSLRDHIPVMEILCAYVRHNAPDKSAIQFNINYTQEGWKAAQHKAITAIPTPPIDIQTILTVIGRRKAKHINFEWDVKANPIKRPYQLDLRNSNLQKLDFTGLNFANTQLDSARMQGAVLNKAEMQGADLFRAEMQGAYLNGTEMQAADLNQAKMQGAYLRETKFDQSTDLTACIFTASAVRLVDFSGICTLTDDQAKSMFGDSTTVLPKAISPPNWATWEVDDDEFFEKWHANL